MERWRHSWRDLPRSLRDPGIDPRRADWIPSCPARRKIFLVAISLSSAIPKAASGSICSHCAHDDCGRSLSTTDDFPLFIKGVAAESGGESTVTSAPLSSPLTRTIRFSFRTGIIIAITVSAIGGVSVRFGHRLHDRCGEWNRDPRSSVVRSQARDGQHRMELRRQRVAIGGRIIANRIRHKQAAGDSIQTIR